MVTLEKENIILNLTFQFALNTIDFVEVLSASQKYIIANQLLKSGTSIGANVREAQHAESKVDFVHKMKIAAKEAEETEYWLLLCKFSTHYPKNEKLLVEIKDIQKVINKIISTTKDNINKQ